MATEEKYIKVPISSLLSAMTPRNGKTITVKELLNETKLKEWYTEQYPTDDMGEELDGDKTLLDVFNLMADGYDFYDIIGVCDSIIRERVFTKLANVMKVDYQVIYYLWLQTN